MNFQQWLNRPVYKAQCRSFKLAQQALGMPELAPAQGLATSGNHVLATFRAYPQYRSPEAIALRLQVADMIRQSRRKPCAFCGSRLGDDTSGDWPRCLNCGAA